MAIFTVHQAKTNLSKLIAGAMSGNDVVIARHGQPLVRLVPVASIKPRRRGALRGQISLTSAFFEPLPADEQDSWNGGR